MKFILTSFFFAFCLLLTGSPVHAVGSVHSAPVVKEAVHPEGMQKKELSRQEKRTMRKQLKTQIKSAIKAARASDTDFLLLVIIAILLPPLAMFLYDGASNRFWISLLLTLLFFLPGMIYTLIVILGEN